MAAVVTRSSETGQRIMDTVVLKIPIVGPLVSKLALSRFGRAMAVLIRSGGPMLEGLGVVSGALGNRVVGDAVLAARERMQQGESMSQSLQRNGLIPPMVPQEARVLLPLGGYRAKEGEALRCGPPAAAGTRIATAPGGGNMPRT